MVYSSRGLATYIGTTALGVLLGGVIVALVTSRLGAAESRPVPSAQPEPDQRALEATRLLGARLARLESASIRPDASAVPTPTVPEPRSQASSPQSRPTPEQVKERVLAGRDARQRAFEAEQYDASWSGMAATKVQDRLAELSTNGRFTLDRVECRSSLCRASVRWNSYDDASANWRNLIHADVGMACESVAFVPPPEKWDEPYESSAFYDCADERAK